MSCLSHICHPKKKEETTKVKGFKAKKNPTSSHIRKITQLYVSIFELRDREAVRMCGKFDAELTRY